MLDDSMVRAFDDAFAGELIGPGDEGYETARRVWNGMVDRRPVLIGRCADEGDVVAALSFARERGLPVAVRGGGGTWPATQCATAAWSSTSRA